LVQAWRVPSDLKTIDASGEVGAVNLGSVQF
jgi:hypothetical protein